MFKLRMTFYALLFLLPIFLLPLVTHRLVAEERAYGRETGQGYLRATAEMWAVRLASGEALPTTATGDELPVVVAEVDAQGADRRTKKPFPLDQRCFGEAERNGCRVRATWPGPVGRGQVRVRRFVRLETLACAGSSALLLLGAFALTREIVRARRSVREQIDYVADVSHRLKTPLTSISLCAELAKDGRLDERRKEESAQTIVSEAAKLGIIVDEVLAHVRGMRRG